MRFRSWTEQRPPRAGQARKPGAGESATRDIDLAVSKEDSQQILSLKRHEDKLSCTLFLNGPSVLLVCFIHYLFIFRLFWRNRSTVRYHTPVPQFLDFSVNLTFS